MFVKSYNSILIFDQLIKYKVKQLDIDGKSLFFGDSKNCISVYYSINLFAFLYCMRIFVKRNKNGK